MLINERDLEGRPAMIFDSWMSVLVDPKTYACVAALGAAFWWVLRFVVRLAKTVGDVYAKVVEVRSAMESAKAVDARKDQAMVQSHQVLTRLLDDPAGSASLVGVHSLLVAAATGTSPPHPPPPDEGTATSDAAAMTDTPFMDRWLARGLARVV